MTLVDSSAWVELLRATHSRTHRRLRDLVASDEELSTSDPITLELLAGARTISQARRVRGALAACRQLPVRSTDWEDAASIYLTCRRAGSTPRSLMDCLLAAVAIRSAVPVLAQDKDFKAIAAHTALELA